MKSLDEIKPNILTTMTWPMLVLFASAGCNPTMCHACEKVIKAGQKFKLVPHQRDDPEDDEVFRRVPSDMKYAYYNAIDEMCCVRCGVTALKRRDKVQEKDWRKTRSGGFSRPSIKTN